MSMDGPTSYITMRSLPFLYESVRSGISVVLVLCEQGIIVIF